MNEFLSNLYRIHGNRYFGISKLLVAHEVKRRNKEKGGNEQVLSPVVWSKPE